MSAQELNVDIYRSLSVIAEDEKLLEKAAKALKRIIKRSTKPDDTAMTEEEFLAMVEQGIEQYEKGEYYEMLPGESLDDFLKRVG